MAGQQDGAAASQRLHDQGPKSASQATCSTHLDGLELVFNPLLLLGVLHLNQCLVGVSLQAGAAVCCRKDKAARCRFKKQWVYCLKRFQHCNSLRRTSPLLSTAWNSTSCSLKTYAIHNPHDTNEQCSAAVATAPMRMQQLSTRAVPTPFAPSIYPA